jgi:hypothetical protein
MHACYTVSVKQNLFFQINAAGGIRYKWFHPVKYNLGFNSLLFGQNMAGLEHHFYFFEFFLKFFLNFFKFFSI